jgi:hypothetical protein
MKRLIIATCLGFGLVGSAIAGPLTQGIEFTGGENSLAGLVLQRAQNIVAEDGVLKLQVAINHAQKLKGYGFVLQYDQSKYEFVEARQVDQNLLDMNSGQPALFLASNKTPGQVAVGAMKVDGQAVSGDGALVEFTFKTTQTPLASDFQILDGVMVDLAGGIDAITNIEIGSLKPMPKDYALGQNVPNPFNPSTTIEYRLPEAGDVQLVIYNLLGQEVRTLVRESMDAGFHSVVWDGTDEFGKQVASGIYIYRMSVADFTQVQRMMLLK